MDLPPEEIARLKASIVAVEPTAELREVLANDFPETCAALPISGGWGRVKDRAIVFAAQAQQAQLGRLEDLIAKHIIYEELITFRPFDDRFNGIIVEPAWRQRLREARDFDHVTVRVTCWPERQWRFMESEVRKHDFGRDPRFDPANFIIKRDAWKITYEREFWFDVTNAQPE